MCDLLKRWHYVVVALAPLDMRPACLSSQNEKQISRAGRLPALFIFSLSRQSPPTSPRCNLTLREKQSHVFETFHDIPSVSKAVLVSNYRSTRE